MSFRRLDMHQSCELAVQVTTNENQETLELSSGFRRNGEVHQQEFSYENPDIESEKSSEVERNTDESDQGEASLAGVFFWEPTS